MQEILVLDKWVGETPLECIERFRKSHSEYEKVKMTYAGRLDPMASGVLLVLAGDKVYEKDRFLKLPKTYECVAILGIDTDTYDVLGIPSSPNSIPNPSSWQEEGNRTTELLESFVGTFTQKYPPYSSKTISGKQMHALAREGELEGLEIPSQTVIVENISNIRMASIATEDLVQEITENIKKVTGDFRQSESIQAWNKMAQENQGKRVELVLFSTDVSGGTYIRGIVHELGQKLAKGACILRLKRTTVGEYRLLDKTL
jgi:tRNA pseudouridine55 synthase